MSGIATTVMMHHLKACHHNEIEIIAEHYACHSSQHWDSTLSNRIYNKKSQRFRIGLLNLNCALFYYEFLMGDEHKQLSFFELLPCTYTFWNGTENMFIDHCNSHLSVWCICTPCQTFKSIKHGGPGLAENPTNLKNPKPINLFSPKP